MLEYAWNINDINNESLGGCTPIFYNATIQNVKFPYAYHCIEKLTLMIDVSGPDYRQTGYINYGDDITYETHYWLHNLPHIIPCLIDIIDVINTSTHSNLTKKDLLTIITEPQNLNNDWV